jgi:hypothetical protein
MKELWVLEWSHEANMFHTQPLAESLRVAMNHFMTNTAPNDWIPIFIGTEEQVDARAAQLDQIMVARQQIKGEDK